MKILILPPSTLAEPAAGVRRTIEVYSRFKRHKVTISLDWNVLHGADPYFLKKTDSFASKVYATARVGIRLLLDTFRLAREAMNTDLVLSYSEYTYSVVYSYIVARLSRRPLAVFFHIVVPELEARLNRRARGLSSQLYRSALRYSSHFLCLNNGKVENILKKYYPGKPIHLGLNGVEVSLQKTVYDPQADESDGIFVGTLQGRKGISYLPAIWSRVVKVLPNAQLFLIGKSSEESVIELKGEFSKSGLDGRTKLLGFVSEDYKSHLLEKTKVFVFPSTDEGVSLALLEALAHGVPAVIWDLPCFNMFNDGTIKTNAFDISEFSQNIVDLLQDAKLRERLQSMGRKWVSDNMSWEKAAENEECIYDQIELDASGEVC